MRYREVFISSNTFKIQEFDSISDLTSYLGSAPYSDLFRSSSKSSQDLGRSWSGTHSYEAAQELLSKGWSPEAEKLAKRVPVQTSPTTVYNSKAHYSTVGFQCSVARYLQGIPTNMIDHKKVAQKQKIIVLNKDMAYSASWTPERIEAEGIKALQVIQSLEGKGYRVKMNMVFLTKQNNEIATGVVCVKKPEERFSLIKMAFPLAHTGMLRRIMFKWLECLPTLNSTGFTSGYGMPVGAMYSQLCKKGEYVLPNEIGNIEKYIENILSKQ